MFKQMKNLFLGLVVFAVALVSSVSLEAQTFSGTGTDVSTNLNYFIATARGAGTARINFISATSDKAGSVVQFYTSGAPVTITAAGAATNTVTAVGTGNFSGSDIVIVRHVSADTYERAVVDSVTATNITWSANLGSATAIGDLLYKASTASTIPVGNATVTVNAAGGGLFNGREGRPTLLVLDGTSACQLNTVSGEFRKIGGD
jgi:hypothetical protein